MDGTVIVADDDRTIRTVLSQALTRAGCKVRSTGLTSTLWKWIEEGEGDVVVTDVKMPDGDALDFLPAIRKKRPQLPVIVISAQNTMLTTLRATDAGAFEYFPKPFDLKEILSTVHKALAGNVPKAPEVEVSQDVLGAGKIPLIGRSQAMQDIYRTLARLIHSDLPLLLTGESGTGKELIARVLHSHSNRKAGNFVVLDLSSCPVDRIDETLFGSDHLKSKLEEANGGFLFLNEIGEMPLEAQARLLRVLQDRQFTQTDTGKIIKTDFRIISSTQKMMRDLIEQGRFREDLFYRLNVVPLRIPPLSERRDDIPDLIYHFLAQLSARGGAQYQFTKTAVDLLKTQKWRGNVRELKNFIERLCALSPAEVIDKAFVEEQIGAGGQFETVHNTHSGNLSASVEHHVKRFFELTGEAMPAPGLYNRIIKEVEMPLITLTLAATRGNQIKTAEILGINRNTLRKKIKELDVQVSRSKKLM